MLTRATTVLAVLFMVGSIALAIAWQKAPGSVVSGLKMPAAPTAPAKTPAVPAKK
jgi:preprotein translocase subunit SecG